MRWSSSTSRSRHRRRKSQIPQWSQGHGYVSVPTIERCEEPLAHAPVVRLELGDAERLALAAPVLDVDALDGRALDPRDLLGVEAELQDVRRLRRPRELRVDRLVPPVGLPLEEVREPAPARRRSRYGW